MSSDSQCLLVELGLLCPEGKTTDLADAAVEVPVGEARPPGISQYSTATESEVDGSSWPRADDMTRHVDATVAKAVGEARPPGIAEHSVATASVPRERVQQRTAEQVEDAPQFPEAVMLVPLQQVQQRIAEKTCVGGAGPFWPRASGMNSVAATAAVKSQSAGPRKNPNSQSSKSSVILSVEFSERIFDALKYLTLSMRVEGVVKLFQRPFLETDAFAHVIFLFEMEYRRLRLYENQKNSVVQEHTSLADFNGPDRGKGIPVVFITKDSSGCCAACRNTIACMSFFQRSGVHVVPGWIGDYGAKWRFPLAGWTVSPLVIGSSSLR